MMKNFLREISEESNEYRQQAMRIENMSRELTNKYRELEYSAHNRISQSERPVSATKRTSNVVISRVVQKQPQRLTSRSLSMDYMNTKRTPSTARRPNFMITQRTVVHKKENPVPKTSRSQGKAIFDLDAIPDPKANQRVRTALNQPDRFRDI
ncbi:hypothetical protein TVAG_218100 [Trichomonas vaginalis G3]|uniref:Uncharacterized protein n=1 Tax=Trichomonas vaginalis (strain ATCC PRA-98 / G3) TaxID=412133 RepID=A2FD03_TRIV3|nr:hypothetical protein TVAGG3_0422820 [Trichomonas vaginalis G3]EAX97196.1 hypothetical protein TVAG_218100 [Trichomonas vaginalis G3]KAI5536185.1 hypothetical protein TVAGG3_0422820 [Trichomonas vaginalis G3]|eukprot:XP_001310126.1 hypothetical protein [Trichomonas vaginalis G3]